MSNSSEQAAALCSMYSYILVIQHQHSPTVTAFSVRSSVIID